MPYPIVDMCLYFFIYSFCGWLMETILCSIQERRFVNRGFVNGPLCPIYGCGILLILIFLIPVRNSVNSLYIALPVVFLAGTALASVVEYLTSWAMEKLFHARWWDYSHMKYNVRGRISLSISLIWGALATAFLYLIQPLFERLVGWLNSISSVLPAALAAVMAGLFLIDVIISVKVARRIGNKLEQLDKWLDMIGEFVEGLELPTKEEALQKVQGVYERLAQVGKRPRTEPVDKPEHEWGVLSLESLRDWLTDTIAELRSKRFDLMNATRPLQRRMLRAFPRLTWQGRRNEPSELTNHTSLEEWKDRLSPKKEQPNDPS